MVMFNSYVKLPEGNDRSLFSLTDGKDLGNPRKASQISEEDPSPFVFFLDFDWC